MEDFYSVKQIQTREGGFAAYVVLNVAHRIYAAHFPGNPVTPGVCLLQMNKELLEMVCGVKLRMTGAKNIKFLRAINPLQYAEVVFSVNFNIEGRTVTATSTIGCGEDIFVKISAGYEMTDE